MQPLTEDERRMAEKNHNLLYSFLHRHGYDLENFYDVAVMGFLKGIQIYNRKEDLRKKYLLAFICERYMSAEIGNYFRTQNAKKRKPVETVISLDADYTELGDLYDCIGGKSANPESEIIEAELLSELLENLTESQREIVEMKLNGYSNKETYLILDIKPSTYYKEMRRIRSALENLVG